MSKPQKFFTIWCGMTQKEIFWMKIIFETKEQEFGFIRALIKMDKFHVGGYIHWQVIQYGHQVEK